VTGAAGAIGGALAELVARRAPDAHLTLVDRDRAGVEAIARRLGATPAVWDFARPGELEALHGAAVDAHGPLDVLASCAGVMELRSLAATPWGMGSDLLAIDLVSPLRLMSLAVLAMVARRGGVVINVASMAGLVPLRGASYYGAAKAGLAMASEIAHLELAPRGVHVLTVYPGPVASDLERRARAQVPATWLARALPTGRPDELARRMIAAVDSRRARVVYPPLYALAAEALGVSRYVTSSFSPDPVA